MTREEAIADIKDILEEATSDEDAVCYVTSEDAKALNMAIEALQTDAEQGEWIEEGEYAECSMCGAHSGTQFDGVEPIPLKTKFCPNCGARMKGGVE